MVKNIDGKISKCADLLRRTTNFLYVVCRYKLRNKNIFFNNSNPTGLVPFSQYRILNSLVGINRSYCDVTTHIPHALQKLYVTDHHISIPFYKIGPIYFEVISIKDQIFKFNMLKFTLRELSHENSGIKSMVSDDLYPWVEEVLENDSEIFGRMAISSPHISLIDDKYIYTVMKHMKNIFDLYSIEKACDVFTELLFRVQKDLIWSKYRRL